MRPSLETAKRRVEHVVAHRPTEVLDVVEQLLKELDESDGQALIAWAGRRAEEELAVGEAKLDAVLDSMDAAPAVRRGVFARAYEAMRGFEKRILG